MARRALKPPIEDLSPAARQRIEQRVFERLDRDPQLDGDRERTPLARERRQRGAFALAAAALVASVLAVVVALRSQGSPTAPTEPIASVETVTRDETAARAPAAPIPTPGPSIVTTTGPTQTTLGESRLSIANHSAVRVEGNDREGWLVWVDAGSVHFDVAPRADRPDFVVRAGDVAVHVVGTRFDVTRRAGATRVAVQEGRVRVEQGLQQRELGPGDSFPGEPDGDRVEAGTIGRERSVAREKRARPAERARRDFERAARLELTDPAASRAIYRKLAAASGPWAANALYAEARLQLEAGNREAARPLLLRYLDRYPNGANAPDARRLLATEPGSAPPRDEDGR